MVFLSLHNGSRNFIGGALFGFSGATGFCIPMALGERVKSLDPALAIAIFHLTLAHQFVGMTNNRTLLCDRRIQFVHEIVKIAPACAMGVLTHAGAEARQVILAVLQQQIELGLNLPHLCVDCAQMGGGFFCFALGKIQHGLQPEGFGHGDWQSGLLRCGFGVGCNAIGEQCFKAGNADVVAGLFVHALLEE